MASKSPEIPSTTEEDSFFGDVVSDDSVRFVDGNSVAFKVNNSHNNASKVGFCITTDNIIRADWKRIGDPAKNNYVATRYREISTQDAKDLASYDIGTPWMYILGISPRRKFNTTTKRYEGIWKNSDWAQLKEGTGSYKPHQHVRVFFLHPKTLQPLHVEPIQIRLDGSFGSTFEKKLKDAQSTLRSKISSFISKSNQAALKIFEETNKNNVMPNVANEEVAVPPTIPPPKLYELTEDEMFAHVPLQITLARVKAKSAKSENSSLACNVKGFSFFNDFKGKIPEPGSELSQFLIDRVAETKGWIDDMVNNASSSHEEADEDISDPVDPMLSPEQQAALDKVREVSNGVKRKSNDALSDVSPSKK